MSFFSSQGLSIRHSSLLMKVPNCCQAVNLVNIFANWSCEHVVNISLFSLAFPTTVRPLQHASSYHVELDCLLCWSSTCCRVVIWWVLRARFLSYLDRFTRLVDRHQEFSLILTLLSCFLLTHVNRFLARKEQYLVVDSWWAQESA